MYFDYSTNIEFKCGRCGNSLMASFYEEDGTDKVGCSCGAIWIVVRPIETLGG